MKGVILAAGKGTRLYPVTYSIPKPLLPLANRPTIYYAFDRLKEMGVTEICVVVGEMEKEMRDFLGDGGSDQGVNLSFVRQTQPQGLAHALGFAKEFVAGDPFVLYLGDAIYGSGFKSYADRFLQSDCANLNIVKAVTTPSRFGVANVEERESLGSSKSRRTPNRISPWLECTSSALKYGGPARFAAERPGR